MGWKLIDSVWNNSNILQLKNSFITKENIYSNLIVGPDETSAQKSKSMKVYVSHTGFPD